MAINPNMNMVIPDVGSKTGPQPAVELSRAMAPDTHAIKTALAARITERIREMSLKQYEVAELLHVDPPRVSTVVRRDLAQFGVFRHMRYVAALGDDLAIVHRPGRGRLSVTAGARE